MKGTHSTGGWAVLSAGTACCGVRYRICLVKVHGEVTGFISFQVKMV